MISDRLVNEITTMVTGAANAATTSMRSIDTGTNDICSCHGNANKILRNTVLGLGVVSCLLVGSIVGASITAFRLPVGGAVDSNMDIDAHTGIAYSNGIDHPVLKTGDAVFYSNNMDIAGMSNDELHALKEVILDDGNVKFQVKGYGRQSSADDDPQVHLIVDGGTLTWDAYGIVDASGDHVTTILDSAFPPSDEDDNLFQNDEEEQEEEGFGHRRRRRRLPSACTTKGLTGGGSKSNRTS